ncbi:MAG: hypothetical protein NC485_09730 [Ruminococcus flavefaciens]|nr:hypothetical protein [Ruminococcus flavefaciens]
MIIEKLCCFFELHSSDFGIIRIYSESFSYRLSSTARTLVSRFIKITQALNRIRNPDANAPKRTLLQINPPKTKHSVRTIPFLQKIAEMLKDYKSEQIYILLKSDL